MSSTKIPPRVVVDWRKPGGRKPSGIVDCTRPSRYGNPYTVKQYGLSEAVSKYREHLQQMPVNERTKLLLPLLAAKGLACNCKLDELCHVDVLREHLKTLTMDQTKLPRWASELRARGWTVNPTHKGIICDYPDGADSGEWRAELYDLSKTHLGRWGWTLSERPDGSFCIELEEI